MSTQVNIPGEPPQGATVFPGTGPSNTTANTPKPAPPPPLPAPPAIVATPAMQLGNPARQYPATAPLDLDDAIARGIPQSIPYPTAPYAGAYSASAWAANYQAMLDFNGVVTQYESWVVSNPDVPPPPAKCQDWATWEGDTFIFLGILYKPGKWTPF